LCIRDATFPCNTNAIYLWDRTLGGSHNIGTLYSWDSELPAFIKLVSTSGTVGTSIGILGQGFTGTTAASFNGVPASFTVVSDTYLTVTVPTAATTGNVTATTPTGILTSNQGFIVLPSITSFSPMSGKVASSVVIMGGGMTNASQVTFGGVKATTFTVNSSSKVTATVPTGAKTGKIAITTPAGTATSSGTFTVLP
jgi:IPT/TIG domain